MKKNIITNQFTNENLPICLGEKYTNTYLPITSEIL